MQQLKTTHIKYEKPRLILVLSGEICCGKSTLCSLLEKEKKFAVLKSRQVILNHALRLKSLSKIDRIFLQQLGERLDESTDGEWLYDAFKEEIVKHSLVVIDAARIHQQILAFRKNFATTVMHIHLKASPSTLLSRYLKKNEYAMNQGELTKKYQEVKNDRTEKTVPHLERYADLVIDTDINSPETVLSMALRAMIECHTELS